MDGQLDVAMVSMLEQKFEKSRFTRVDSDVIDNLIIKEDKKNEDTGRRKARSYHNCFQEPVTQNG